ncbi:MAG: GNAT family N-acetyltransferase [Candidatus Bathyarchaeia archaeon]
MLKLDIIEDFEKFESFMDIWNAVLRRTLDHDVFSTWEWLWCWWKHYGKGRQLRVLMAKDGGKIIGIAPLMLSKYSFHKFGKLNRIEFVGFPHADYNNFLLTTRDLKCLRLILDGLKEISDWDLLDLRDIRNDSVSGQAIQAISQNKNLNLNLTVETLCPYISLASSVDVFVKGLSRNMRRNLKKRMRRLSKGFKVSFKTQRDFDSIDEAMEAFFRLHQERWKSTGKQGVFVSEVCRDFHRDVARIFDNKGWLDLRFLTVNDEPIAAAYTFDYNLKKYGYLTGFSPNFAEFGVGNILKMHLIEECIKKGFREYDLTRGIEPYKISWATGVRRNFTARFARRGLFARMYCWALEKKFLKKFYSNIGTHLTIRSEPNYA